MRREFLFLVVCAAVLWPGVSIAGEGFDGNWHTKLTCPSKGTLRAIYGSSTVSSRTAISGESTAQRGNPAICSSKAKLQPTAALSSLPQA